MFYGWRRLIDASRRVPGASNLRGWFTLVLARALLLGPRNHLVWGYVALTPETDLFNNPSAGAHCEERATARFTSRNHPGLTCSKNAESLTDAGRGRRGDAFYLRLYQMEIEVP